MHLCEGRKSNADTGSELDIRDLNLGQSSTLHFVGTKIES